MGKTKKKLFKVVCLLDETIVAKMDMFAETAQDVVKKVQEDMPDMRLNTARIYLNGFPVSRYKMGQNIYR